MLYLIAIILGVLLGMLYKGKLSNLLNIRFKKIWIIILAFILQSLLRALTVNGWEIAVRYGLIMHCVVFGILFIGFWFNRHNAGLCIIGIGSFLNALVMALNGGRMPVSVGAMAKVGITGMQDYLRQGIDGKHVILDEATRLAFLADIISLPPFLGVLMPVVSVGDLIVGVGIFIFAFCGVKCPA